MAAFLTGSKQETGIDEELAQVQREKTRLKMQKWRNKQKMNKVRYEEFKMADRERKKFARLRQKQKALVDPNYHQELKRKRREETKKYRQKKKGTSY